MIQRYSSLNASIALKGAPEQGEAGPGLLVVDADIALCIKRHGSLSLHSVAFCGRSRIGQQREHLESSSRHYSATEACANILSVRSQEHECAG